MAQTQPGGAAPRSNARSSHRQKPKGSTRAAAFHSWHGLGKNLAVSVLDVSETGVRLLLRKDLPIGHEFEIKLDGAASKSVKTVAQVIWSVPAADGNFVIGARFHTPISYAELHLLAKI